MQQPQIYMTLTQQMLDNVTFVNVGFMYSDCVLSVHTLYMYVALLSVQHIASGTKGIIY